MAIMRTKRKKIVILSVENLIILEFSVSYLKTDDDRGCSIG